MNKLIRVLSASFLSMASTMVAAESMEEKGMKIAVAADQRDSGWKHVMANMEMTLRNRSGKESTRKIVNRQLEVDSDGDKSLS